MGISIEMSLYPLQADYVPVIRDFIENLRQHEALTVITNNMSTRVFGEFEVVMPAVQQEVKTAFEKAPTLVLVMKLINKNLEE